MSFRSWDPGKVWRRVERGEDREKAEVGGVDANLAGGGGCVAGVQRGPDKGNTASGKSWRGNLPAPIGVGDPLQAEEHMHRLDCVKQQAVLGGGVSAQGGWGSRYRRERAGDTVSPE